MVTRFGTTSDMVIQTVAEGGQDYLLAIDASGLYLTNQRHLDTRLADPNRYSGNRRDMSQRLAALGLNADDLFNDNKHMIKSVTRDTKKVNPLKASKRKMKSA